jgi:hypothetical protein
LYGLNMNHWPESFRELVAEFFASKVIRKLSNSDAEEEKCLLRAAEEKAHRGEEQGADGRTHGVPGARHLGALAPAVSGRPDGGGSSGNLIG